MRRGKESAKAFKTWTRKVIKKAIRPSDRSLTRLVSSESSLSSEASLEELEELEDTGAMASGTGTKPKGTREESELAAMEARLTNRLEMAIKDISKQISSQIAGFVVDLEKQNKEIKAELVKNNDQMKKMSDKVDQVTTLAKKNEGSITTQKKQLDALQKKVIYMEDYSRRSNIKLVNFEVQKIAEIKQEVISWINTVVASQPFGDRDFERIHFVGSSKARMPRPIIVRFSTYSAKEYFMANIRSSSALLARGSKTVQIYQDLSKDTSDWRKTMKPITRVLLKNNLRYTWGFPLFLKIWRNSVLHTVYSLEEGMALLQVWGLEEEDQPGSSAAASKI